MAYFDSIPDYNPNVRRWSPVAKKRVMLGLLIASAAFAAWYLTLDRIPGESILRGAQRVEVFRVESEPVAGDPRETIGYRPIISVGREQGADFARRLSDVLRSSGVIPHRNHCSLQPGVAFRLWKGSRAVEVLVCFKCDVLWPHVVGSQVGNVVHEWQDFDLARAELVALTKEAFPDDIEIQALQVNHH